MSGVTYSPAAIADINDIWDCTTRTWSTAQADRYVDDIQNACNGLAAGGKQGRPVVVLDGYLKYTIGCHSDFSVRTDDGITVICVLHQNTEIERHPQLYDRRKG